ncbi:hypothetical protein VPH35_115873 [Triticum aestivum]
MNVPPIWVELGSSRRTDRLDTGSNESLSSPAAAAAQVSLIRGTRWRTPENTFASSGSGKRQAPPGSPSPTSLTAASFFLGGEEKKGKPRRSLEELLGSASSPIQFIAFPVIPTARS